MIYDYIRLSFLFSGQCPSGYFSCHTCCEPREKDYCKCDKNNGAIPKTLYRPSE